ncbi:hypothetical protein B0J13DRAFT_628861 [Dactylonectria estremocensis]|uniref:Uncharacterized protein n=1 Tax=Dactylonectria estremocensis TaxID=1079267 RepID=A0A9P9DLI7_9HYPO|nr:hypothetical protein B0J13DRAFT_628861 [Dactylonectria estremocensis]
MSTNPDDRANASGNPSRRDQRNRRRRRRPERAIGPPAVATTAQPAVAVTASPAPGSPAPGGPAPRGPPSGGSYSGGLAPQGPAFGGSFSGGPALGGPAPRGPAPGGPVPGSYQTNSTPSLSIVGPVVRSREEAALFYDQVRARILTDEVLLIASAVRREPRRRRLAFQRRPIDWMALTGEQPGEDTPGFVIGEVESRPETHPGTAHKGPPAAGI